MEEAKPREQIELNALSTILDKGVDFEVTYKTKNILHKLKILKSSKKFRIYRIHLNPLLNISKILMEMDIKTIEDDGQLFQLGLDYIVKYKDKILHFQIWWGFMLFFQLGVNIGNVKRL